MADDVTIGEIVQDMKIGDVKHIRANGQNWTIEKYDEWVYDEKYR